jgi:hypothetical protein
MQNPLFGFLAQLWGWLLERPWRILVTGVVAGVIGIISVALPDSLFNSFNCQLQNFPQNYRSSNGYFIDGQVLIVGPRVEVDAMIETLGVPPTTVEPGPSITPTTPGPPLATATFSVLATPTGTPVSPVATGTPAPPVATGTPNGTLKLIEGCDLSYLDSRKDLASEATREPRDLVMRLYEIPSGIPVAEVITQIESIAEGKEIFADPNYLTRLADLPNDPCALAGDGGGNGGRPFGGPGTFTVDPTTYNVAQAQDVFRDQWAFDSIDMPTLVGPTSPTGPTGDDVRVGVLDTSPDRISFPFIKRVRDALPSPLWFTNWDAGGTTMASSHGLFVAELIHAMAPNSRVQLIRVLYEDGCGDLWTLNKGLEDYKSRMSAWTERLDKTVINMSLGIRVPGPAKNNEAGSEVGPGDTTPGTSDEATEILTALFNERLETLKSLIHEADKMGAIIIASAGNDSTKIIDPITNTPVVETAEMQIPANLEEVIGVAAANPGGVASCYTSRGDVGAPGGEGGEVREDPKDLCAPRAFSWDQSPGQCTDIAKCEYGLVSLAQTRYGPRYMLWSGTSFAAPLVSGLAALANERNTRDQVKCMIEKGASGPDPILGWGLISITRSLDSTIIAECQRLFPHP